MIEGNELRWIAVAIEAFNDALADKSLKVSIPYDGAMQIAAPSGNYVRIQFEDGRIVGENY